MVIKLKKGEKERFLWRGPSGVGTRECDRSGRGTRVRRMTCIVIGPGGVGLPKNLVHTYSTVWVWYYPTI